MYIGDIKTNSNGHINYRRQAVCGTDVQAQLIAASPNSSVMRNRKQEMCKFNDFEMLFFLSSSKQMYRTDRNRLIDFLFFSLLVFFLTWWGRCCPDCTAHRYMFEIMHCVSWLKAGRCSGRRMGGQLMSLAWLALNHLSNLDCWTHTFPK